MLSKKELAPSLLLFRIYSAINFQPLTFDSKTGLAKPSSTFRILHWKFNLSLLLTYTAFLNFRLLQVVILPQQYLNPVHFPLHFMFAIVSAWCVHTASIVFLESPGSTIKIYNEVVTHLENGTNITSTIFASNRVTAYFKVFQLFQSLQKRHRSLYVAFSGIIYKSCSSYSSLGFSPCGE